MANQTLGTTGALRADLAELQRKLAVEACEARTRAIAAENAYEECHRVAQIVIEDIPSLDRYHDGIAGVQAYIEECLRYEQVNHRTMMPCREFIDKILRVHKALEAIEEGI